MHGLQDLEDQMEQKENAHHVGTFYESYNTWKPEDQLWV